MYHCDAKIINIIGTDKFCYSILIFCVELGNKIKNKIKKSEAKIAKLMTYDIVILIITYISDI